MTSLSPINNDFSRQIQQRIGVESLEVSVDRLSDYICNQDWTS